jgi:hypothetical protein
VRSYDITAVLANDVLDNVVEATIPENLNPTDNVGGTLDPDGGTLVYNPRATGLNNGKSGPLHDPTAILYVRTDDLLFEPGTKTIFGNPIGLRPGAPVEPIVLRANAGECIEVRLRNALLNQAAVLASDETTFVPVVDGSGLPVFVNLGQSLFADLNQDGVIEFVDTNGDGLTEGVLAANVLFDQVPDLAGYHQLTPVVRRENGAQGVTWFQSSVIGGSVWFWG